MPTTFIAAICPKCGGELRVPEGLEKIKCMYCGVDIIQNIQENDAQKILRETSNFYTLANEAEKNSKYQEAYSYYSAILEKDINNKKAWLGRGFCAGMLSTFESLRFNEAINDFENGYPIYGTKNQTFSKDACDNTPRLDFEQNDELRVLSFCYHMSLSVSFYNWQEKIELTMPNFDNFSISRELLQKNREYQRNSLRLKMSILFADMRLTTRAYGHFYNEDVIENWKKCEVVNLIQTIIFFYLNFWRIFAIACRFETKPYDNHRKQICLNIKQKLEPYKELITDERINQHMQEYLSTAKFSN